MPWSLRWIVLSPPEDPRPDTLTAQLAPSPVFEGQLSQTVQREVVAALADGWEPFAVAPLRYGDHVLWLRQWADTGPPTFDVSELPGQYL